MATYHPYRVELPTRYFHMNGRTIEEATERALLLVKKSEAKVMKVTPVSYFRSHDTTKKVDYAKMVANHRAILKGEVQEKS